MRIEVVREYCAFLALKQAWEPLLERVGMANVFLSWDWLSHWWHYYGGKNRMLILCGIGEDGCLAAAVPLMIRKRRMDGLPLRCVEFIGSGNEVTPDHLRFVCPAESAGDFSGSVFRYLRDQARDWDVIRLTDMRFDPEVDNACRELFAGWEYKFSPRGVCPYVELPRSWEQYTAGLSKRSRRNTGQFERELAKRFRLEISVCGDVAELETLMGSLEETHRKRMAAKKPGARESSLQDVFWRFHRGIASAMLKKGALFMGALRLNGEVAACQYGFGVGGSVFMYQCGLDPQYRRHSAGFVLFAKMIKEAICRGFKEFDFLRGDEEYKFHFTKKARRNMELTVWNRTLRARSAALLHRVASAAKKAVRPPHDGVPGEIEVVL